MRLAWSKGGMGVAITFCDETEQKGRENEDGYSLFHWSEAESLPHFNEFETPVLFQLADTFRFNS
jgi:hypothetical protein